MRVVEPGLQCGAEPRRKKELKTYTPGATILKVNCPQFYGRSSISRLPYIGLMLRDLIGSFDVESETLVPSQWSQHRI